MQTSDETLATFSALGLARLAVSGNGELSKQACENLGGIPALLKWANSTNSSNLLEAVSMAICNISTRPENQVRNTALYNSLTCSKSYFQQILLAKLGLYQLINLAREIASTKPTAWKYLSGALSNMASHASNRTMLYKAELSAKMVDSRQLAQDLVIDEIDEYIRPTGGDEHEGDIPNKRKESALADKKKSRYLDWFNNRYVHLFDYISSSYFHNKMLLISVEIKAANSCKRTMMRKGSCQSVSSDNSTEKSIRRDPVFNLSKMKRPSSAAPILSSKIIKEVKLTRSASSLQTLSGMPKPTIQPRPKSALTRSATAPNGISLINEENSASLKKKVRPKTAGAEKERKVGKVPHF